MTEPYLFLLSCGSVDSGSFDVILFMNLSHWGEKISHDNDIRFLIINCDPIHG